ncbi:MAG TPA: TlpA disulfide reductase family protein [Terriglobales bacterium]|nr:TlpA disulfide reductase family protein [Terriglobales bacterium]
MRRDPVVIIVVAMVVTVMLVFGFQMARRKSREAASQGPNLQGKAAPDFTLHSLEGQTVHLSDFRGKGVLLNFWATWCQPCKIEMPWFAELQKQYGPQGLQIVGVAMDDAGPKEISKFAHDLGVNYPILVGEESVGDAYGGLPFLPATFYIGRDGKVLDKVYGLKGRGEIEDSIKKALATGQPLQAQK